MTNGSKAPESTDVMPPVRISGRHFVPRPRKPGIGRPVRGRVLARPAGRGGRP